ncbi:MAG: signal peptidase II [Deltaproteobacteria bacterium]|nr:signal peptidase II [Deltaproteobacteria bacterium]MBW2394708.1 signal peptidase II [Deltaproteobacteria bacterium]
MRRTRLLFFLLLVVGSVGCDHATKHLAHEALAGVAPISLIGNLVRLELAANPGAFLSLGAELPPVVRSVLLVGGVPILLALVCAAAFRTGLASPAAFAGLALITGGGLANWLDRILHGGAVTDFVSLGLPGLRTGIFNLADVVIVAGFLLFAFQRRVGGGDARHTAT